MEHSTYTLNDLLKQLDKIDKEVDFMYKVQKDCVESDTPEDAYLCGNIINDLLSLKTCLKYHVKYIQASV